MVNKIDDFVPYKLLLFVTETLKEIDPARGYNTRPRVTTDVDEFEASEARHTLFVETEGGSPAYQGAGSAHTTHQTLAVQIVGVSKYETEHPRRVAMALEQDVRTALHVKVDTELRAAIGRGCSFRFLNSEHDGGYLAPEKEAGFKLTVSFTWSQNSDW